MFWMRRAAPTDPAAAVSRYIVWCVTSDGISRQQMVTVCLLNFSNIFSHTNTHLHTVTRLKDKKNPYQSERENQFIHFLFPCITKACIVYDLHVSRHHHIDKHAYIVTKARLYQPWHQSRFLRMREELWMADWLKDHPPSHPSFQPVYHPLSVQSICWEEKGNHLGQPWPSSHPVEL